MIKYFDVIVDLNRDAITQNTDSYNRESKRYEKAFPRLDWSLLYLMALQVHD